MLKLKRRRDKEYPWVNTLRNIFSIPMYIINSEDGNKYAVVARYASDAAYYYAHKLQANSYRGSERCDVHPFFKNDGSESIYHKPFWCYGRVYEVVRN